MPSDGVVCVECGKIFSENDVIRYGNAAVCANCKPIFVQRLKEGVSQPGGMDYAGFWIRFGAKFLDGIILMVVNSTVNFLLFRTAAGSASANAALGTLVLSTGINMLFAVSYNTFFIGNYGATPGKMAAKIRIVRPDGSKVGYGRACARYFAEIVSGLTLSIGYLIAAFDEEKRSLHDRICDTRVIKA